MATPIPSRGSLQQCRPSWLEVLNAARALKLLHFGSRLRYAYPLCPLPFGTEKLDTRLRLGETGKHVYGLVQRNDNRPGTSQA